MNNSLLNVINSNFCRMIKNELIQNLINDNLYTDKTHVSLMAGYSLEKSVRIMVLIDNTPLIELSINSSSDTTSDTEEKILRAYENKYHKSKSKGE